MQLYSTTVIKVPRRRLCLLPLKGEDDARHGSSNLHQVFIRSYIPRWDGEAEKTHTHTRDVLLVTYCPENRTVIAGSNAADADAAAAAFIRNSDAFPRSIEGSKSQGCQRSLSAFSLGSRHLDALPLTQPKCSRVYNSGEV